MAEGEDVRLAGRDACPNTCRVSRYWIDADVLSNHQEMAGLSPSKPGDETMNNLTPIARWSHASQFDSAAGTSLRIFRGRRIYEHPSP